MARDQPVDRLERDMTNPVVEDPGKDRPAGYESAGGEDRLRAGGDPPIVMDEVEHGLQVATGDSGREDRVLPGSRERHQPELGRRNPSTQPRGRRPAETAILVVEERCRRDQRRRGRSGARAAFSANRISTIRVTSDTGIGRSAGNRMVPFPDRYGARSSPNASTTAPLAGKRL